MTKESLTLLRGFLFRAFIVGLLFALIVFGFTYFFWDRWSLMVCSKFLLTKEELGKLVVNSFIYTRFFLIFFLLTPAISLYWTLKKK